MPNETMGKKSILSDSRSRMITIFVCRVRSEFDCVYECATSITWRRENAEEEPKNREKNKHVVGRKRMEIFEIVSDT